MNKVQAPRKLRHPKLKHPHHESLLLWLSNYLDHDHPDYLARRKAQSTRVRDAAVDRVNTLLMQMDDECAALPKSKNTKVTAAMRAALPAQQKAIRRYRERPLVIPPLEASLVPHDLLAKKLQAEVIEETWNPRTRERKKTLVGYIDVEATFRVPTAIRLEVTPSDRRPRRTIKQDDLRERETAEHYAHATARDYLAMELCAPFWEVDFDETRIRFDVRPAAPTAGEAIVDLRWLQRTVDDPGSTVVLVVPDASDAFVAACANEGFPVWRATRMGWSPQ